jgi:hypothetical protein
VLTKAHIPFERWTTEGEDLFAEYGCTFSPDGKLAAVVRTGKWALVDLERGNVIREVSFSRPLGSRPTVRMNQIREVFVHARNFPGQHLYKWNPATTGEPEELSNETVLPADTSGAFLEEQTSHLGVRRSVEISGSDAIADIWFFDEAGRPRTLCSYIANGRISFMGITPEGDRVIIGDHAGDIAICSIENARL